MTNILEAVGLTKKFGENITLNNLNLTVKSKQIVCLLGANGAGKTTTLNLFLGFLAPDGGTVRVAGYDPIAESEQARSALGYVPETVALYPKLSGLENLKFFHELNGYKHISKDRLFQALENVGLTREAAQRRSETYSKGMRQKVGLAAAFLKNSQALLLDEPLSGLDPDATNQFQELVLDAANRGVSVLMATHDIFRAKEIATQIGIMRNGNLIEFLNADEIDLLDLEALYLRHMRSIT